MEDVSDVAFRHRRGGDALHADVATNGLLLAVIAGVLRPGVLDEEQGMQHRNLCLCQDFFISLYE